MTAPAPGHGAKGWARAVRNRNLVVLLVGRSLSAWGDALCAIALVWLVYKATASPLAVAGMGAALRAVPLLVGPAAGVFIDRWDRRRAMVGADAVRLLLVLALALLTARHALSAGVAYAIVFALAAAAMPYGPALHAIMVRMLPREDLAAANSLYVSASQANRLAASAVGGVVVGLVGATASFLLDAVSFACGILSVLALDVPDAPDAPPPPAAPAATRPSFGAQFRQGVRVLAEDRRLRPLLVVVASVTLGGSAFQAILPVLVFRQLGGGPAMLGALEAVAVAAAVAGALVPGWLARRLAVGSLLAAATASLGLGVALVGLAHDGPLGAAGMAILGLAEGASAVVFATFFQTTVPEPLMGRFFGLVGAVEAAGGAPASLAAGILAGPWGAGAVAVAAGAWVAATAVVAFASGALRARALPAAQA